MKVDKRIFYGLIGFLIGVIFMAIFTDFLSQDSRENETSSSLESHFIEQMIPHHEDAVTMANIALTKAKTDEVKKMAGDIIEAQTEEIDQMTQWYKEWFGKGLPKGDDVMNNHHGMGSDTILHMGMLGTEEDLSQLENAENFDRAFVEHMIPHHQMAVMMASMLKDGTDKKELKQLSDNIITTQTEEIEQMREWLIEWDGKDE